MNAVTRSIALTVLLFGARVSAAEKPAPKEPAKEQEGVIVLSMDGANGDHYWIGVDANPLSPEQRKELHVDDDQGLLINAVTPDSPAAKAGLEAHDILLKAGKTPLKQVADLAKAIQETKDHQIQLDIKRDGKPLAIAVTPAKRPGGGLTFRLVNPEISFGGSDAASAEKSKAEGASRQALTWLKARAAEPEQSSLDDAKVRERIKELLAHRHELQQRVKDLNEKLKSLSNANNPDRAAAENFRSEIHAAEQAIEAINQQTVMIELSRGNPDREKLTRQLRTLRQCAADLAEVGRTEEASHLGAAAHEIEQRLQAIGPENRQSGIRALFQVANPSLARAVVQADPGQMRLSQIQTAIQLLGQNGMPEEAERIRQRADAIAREQQLRRETADGRVGPPAADSAILGLRDQVEQMRREMAELKEAVARMSQRKD